MVEQTTIFSIISQHIKIYNSNQHKNEMGKNIEENGYSWFSINNNHC